MTDSPGRADLLRWMGWFAIANALLLAVVGLRYFNGFTPGGSVLSWLYLVLVYPAHHVLLAVLPLFLLLTPVILIGPSWRWATVLAVLLYALMIAVVVLDSLLWSQSRFHINFLTLKILGWQSWLFVAVMFLIAVLFEALLAAWVRQWLQTRRQCHGKALAVVMVCALLGAQLIHAWADANYYVPVTSVAMQLPVYKGFTAKRQLMRLGWVSPQQSRERALARRLARQLGGAQTRLLNYPIEPLRCLQQHPMNLLLIMVDAMRSDLLSPQTSPYLWRYATQQSQWFTRHMSGGNSSRMGFFSLFYGLPPGYWSSFESLQRSTVLVDEMQRKAYQLGLFTSSTMYRPVTLDRTAFANVPDLRLQTEPAGAPAWQRDQIITAQWQEWLRQRHPDRPFFGFLLYDAANAQVYPPGLNQRPEPATAGQGELARRFADYRQAVTFVDGLIGQVLDDLNRQGVADNTVVIITSDHGEEFDESGLGLRDHGSGYTTYQLQVPLLVHWPGVAAAVFDHRSSHYDIVPTLMQGLLGCSNPPSDYASGRNLFDGVAWDWLLAGSYYNYAVLEPDQITVTYPSGRFEVRDWDYRIASRPHIRGEVLESVARENSRFYRK